MFRYSYNGGSVLNVFVYKFSNEPKTAVVTLTGTAVAGSEKVDLTADPVTVAISNKIGDDKSVDSTLKSADGKVKFVITVRIIVENPQYILSDVFADVTDKSGAAISSKVTKFDSNSITIAVPYDTPDENVTVKLTVGKLVIKYENEYYNQTYNNLTAEPVTVEIGNTRGANFSLISGSNTPLRGKVFVNKEKAPDSSDTSSSTPDSSDTSSSTPDSGDTSASTPTTIGSSTNAPVTSDTSTSTPAVTEKEFKPAVTEINLSDEQKRVLGGIFVTDTNGAFDDDVVMNIAPGQSENRLFSFNITFTKNGQEVQPKSSVTVKVPVPKLLSGKDIYIYHVENGRKVLVNSEVKDGFVIFSADHFSEYILSADKLAETASTETPSSAGASAASNSSASTTAPANNPNTGVAVAAVPVVIAVSAAVIIIAKKKK